MLIEFSLFVVFLFLITIWKESWTQRQRQGKGKFSQDQEKAKSFPGPSVRFPIIGNALQWFWIGTTKNMFDTVHEFCERYGQGQNVCGIWAGSNYFLFIENPYIGKEILNAEILSRKFPATSITYKLYGYKNIGIAQSYGSVSKEMRKFSIRNLKRHGFGKFSQMDHIVEHELLEYLTDFESKLSADGSGIIEMNESFYISTLNILFKMMTGTRFKSDDSRLINLIALARDILKTDPKGATLPHAFQWLTYIPGLTVFKPAQKFWNEIRILFGEYLERRKNVGVYKEAPECFMDSFLQEYENDKEMYSDESCVQSCMDLFVAGMDSTANSLDWMVIYLVSYPKVYEKVMEEVKSVIGFERMPCLEDKDKMPYTQAFMWEVLRIANVITYTVRSPLEETVFKGWIIPAKSHIILKLSCFNKNKEIWGDPETFRPERFLDENQNVVNTEKVFTFGFGKRSCIGDNSSKMTMFLFVTSLVQRFKLELSPKHPKPSLVPERGILISHPRPWHLMATKIIY